MKITFKDVGKGDSILVEWKRDGKQKIGIIDCKKYNGKNPILNQIIELKVNIIDFIFLSHPHTDHYSGMMELLEYCENNNVTILYYIHTMSISPLYIQWAVFERKDKILLANITHKVKALYEKELIQKRGSAGLDWSILLNKDWSIRCLAPSDEERDSYIKQVGLLESKDVSQKECSQAANLLSSILKIYSNKGTFCLLTSDVEIIAFDRIEDRCPEIFDDKLILCQVPHHGSINNHKISFWEKFDKNENCPAVISVGKDGKNLHPNPKVIKDFAAHGFRVYATNHKNSLADFVDAHEQHLLSIQLGDGGIEYEEESDIFYNIDTTIGDQKFKLQPQGAVAL